MEKTSTLPTVAGWVLSGLGTLLSLPWMAAALLAWILGQPLQALVLVPVALGVPLIVGLPLLGRARTLLRAQAPRLAVVYLVLSGLWALAGLVSVLNFLYGQLLLAAGSNHPLTLLLAGVIPPLIGLVYQAQSVVAWPTERARFRRLAGWTYLAVAGLQMVGGLVVLGQGDTLQMLSWLTQASLTALMAAALFERRTQVMAALFVALALAIGLLFMPATGAGQVSTLVLDPTGGMVAWPVSNAVFPTAPSLAMLIGLAVGLGGWQAIREIRLLRLGMGGLLGAAGILFVVLLAVYYGLSTGFFLLVVLALTVGLAAWQILRTRESNGVLGVILFLFILAFLIWASRTKEFNFTGMLISTLEAATPIALGALSGVWCERSAVINIGIEGMMLSAAFTSVVVASATKSLLLGMLLGMLTGGVLAALLAVLAIRFKVNQIIAGTAINIFATGATSFLSARLLTQRQDLNSSANFPRIAIPVLSRIPVIGPVFFQNNLIIYLMLLLVVVTHIILFYSRWGLRSRSVGEHPLAADTLGINVFRTRYINVIIGGMVAGLGGAFYTLASVGRFDEVMTAGRGFIGLAAMIFGRWTPFGAFASSLIFGFASSLQIKLGILEVPIPSHFLLMAPYLVTIIVLAGVVGRAIPPAADGEAYEKH